MAGGEFLALLDHDDELHPDALAHVAEAIEPQPEADYVYTDEDKIDLRGRHSSPFFKPDWSPERLRTQMYTCHLSVLRRSLVEQVGGFDPEFEGAQDGDPALRVTERARAIVDVPGARPLAPAGDLRRLRRRSKAVGLRSRPACRAGALRATGLPADVEMDAADPGVLHLNPKLREQPLVSIVIPTGAQRRDVRFEPVVLAVNCVRSIVERSTYENYEIVCVTDGELDPAVGGGAARDRRRAPAPTSPYEGEFDFSAKVNLGAVHSEGEHLLLLNDDIEVTTPDWLERMVMYSADTGIAAVGGRLVWGDTRLQHVGVSFEGGLPGHLYYGFAGDYRGYMNAVLIARNCLAVTGACLMTRREVSKRLGGLTEEFPVNFNDVDYCLKAQVDGGCASSTTPT